MPYGGRRHSVTELTPALLHSATQRRGWPPPGSWWNNAETRFPGVPKSWYASYGVRALNARTRGQERGERACGCPRARRTPPDGCLALERGGPHSRVGVDPSGEADPARGGVYPLSEADLARGSVYPSSEADPTRGASCCAALAGRGGHQGRGRVLHAFWVRELIRDLRFL
jgi:hypothetical protein